MSEQKRAEIEQRTFDYFQSGFNCAEAISRAIVEAFSEEAGPGIPQVATAFGGGIGGSKGETCGALTGGIIALGCLFGRKQPGDDKKTAYELGAEFRKEFIENFGSGACMKVLERLGEQEKMMKCKKLTGQAAGILYSVIENGIPAAREQGAGCGHADGAAGR